jgi:dTDP-4-amino-4,6-dideoxygalactose transaminase
LHLALLAAGCGEGSEVVLPSLNFVAAANVVVRSGGVPVFCDIAGESDLNLGVGDLRSALTSRTAAVLVLHYGGHPCNMDAVSELAAERGLVVIEDAAHALGASLRGRACGTIGDVGCYSFFSNKNVPVGEGGMLVTDDDELAERARLLRSHGMTTLTWDRERGHAGGYDVVVPGLNYRFDEVRAAMGLVQLERLEAWNARRGAIVARYRELLDGVEGIVMPFRSLAEESKPAHHLAVVLLPSGLDRDGVRSRLRQAGIQTSVHYPPIHRFTAYAQAGSARPLPRTEQVASSILTIPLYPHMRADDVETVAHALLDAVRSA